MNDGWNGYKAARRNIKKKAAKKGTKRTGGSGKREEGKVQEGKEWLIEIVREVGFLPTNKSLLPPRGEGC